MSVCPCVKEKFLPCQECNTNGLITVVVPNQVPAEEICLTCLGVGHVLDNKHALHALHASQCPKCKNLWLLDSAASQVNFKGSLMFGTEAPIFKLENGQIIHECRAVDDSVHVPMIVDSKLIFSCVKVQNLPHVIVKGDIQTRILNHPALSVAFL